jgi:hypothetical protein
VIVDPPLRENHRSNATFLRASDPLDAVVVKAGAEEYVFADESRTIWMRRRDGAIIDDSSLVDLIETIHLRGRAGASRPDLSTSQATKDRRGVPSWYN